LPKWSFICFLPAAEKNTWHLLFEAGAFKVTLTEHGEEDVVEGQTRFAHELGLRFSHPQNPVFAPHEHNVLSVYSDSECLISTMPPDVAAALRPTEVPQRSTQLSRFGGAWIASIEEIRPDKIYLGNFANAPLPCQGRGLAIAQEVIRKSAIESEKNEPEIW
jgi:hypothetical protein